MCNTPAIECHSRTAGTMMYMIGNYCIPPNNQRKIAFLPMQETSPQESRQMRRLTLILSL